MANSQIFLINIWLKGPIKLPIIFFFTTHSDTLFEGTVMNDIRN